MISRNYQSPCIAGCLLDGAVKGNFLKDDIAYFNTPKDTRGEDLKPQWRTKHVSYWKHKHLIFLRASV
jgi:hypothetical protein